MPKSIAIIGAGLSGLTAARELCGAGESVQVFEKEASIAGRMASFSLVNQTWDHGAQYFTARSATFQSQVAKWQAAGVATEWNARFQQLECDSEGLLVKQTPAKEGVRYVGSPAMNAPLVQLADEVVSLGGKIVTNTRVASLEQQNDRWQLATEHGEPLGEFSHVIVAAPAPHAAELLTASPALANAAKSVAMTGCWAMMLLFEEPLVLGFDAAWVRASSESSQQPLAWIACNDSKPNQRDASNGSSGRSWVLHGSPEWTADRFNSRPSEVATELLEAFAKLVGKDLPKVNAMAAHRWRFALPKPLKESALIDQERSLYACGDWCGGPRVEGAYLSGIAVAKAVI